MLMKQSDIYCIFPNNFGFYANNSAKVVHKTVRNASSTLTDDSHETRSKTAEAKPTIPKCHWSRFMELPLKVQQGAQSAVTMLVDNFNQEPVIKSVHQIVVTL